MSYQPTIYIPHLGIVYETGEPAVDCLLRRLKRVSDARNDACDQARSAEHQVRSAKAAEQEALSEMSAIEDALKVLGRPPVVADLSNAAA